MKNKLRYVGSKYSVASLVLVTGIIAACAASAAIVLTLNSNINFGIIEYQTTHSGNISIGTNGAVTLTGSGLMYDTGATPGRISVTPSPATGVLIIKCDSTAKLKSNTGNTILNMNNIQVSVNSGVAYGSGSLCQGIKNSDPAATTVNLASSPAPIIYIGGNLVIPSNALTSAAATSYSSTNSGGKAVTVRVIYQ